MLMFRPRPAPPLADQELRQLDSDLAWLSRQLHRPTITAEQLVLVRCSIDTKLARRYAITHPEEVSP